MAYTTLANLKGPQGKTGPRGLPGTNGVATDEAVAENLDDDSTLTAKAARENTVRSVGARLTVATQNDMTMKLERYMTENVLDVPRIPDNVQYGWALNPKWKNAVQRVINNQGVAKILCVGDSTTYGTGASTPEGYANQNSWVEVMGAHLLRNVAQSVFGMVIPVPGVSAGLTDSRWTIGSGWGNPGTTGVGFGGLDTTLRGAPGSEPLLFNHPHIGANRWDVYYTTITSGSLGEMTVQATGGAPVTVQQGHQTERTIRKVTVSAPTVSTSNVLSIRNTGSTSNIYIVGVEPYLANASRIRIANAGVYSSTTAGWVAPNNNAGVDHNDWNYFRFVQVYEPDLVIFDLGINDSTRLTKAQYVANMQRLIDAAEATGAAVLLKTMIPSGGERAATEAEFVAALKSQLDRNNYPIVDIFNHYRNFERNDYRGWMDDNLHGTDEIYADEGAIVADFLLRYSGH